MCALKEVTTLSMTKYISKLAEYLKKNNDKRIQYHKADGSQDDYDILDSEEQILKLLKRR